ncbi:MAG: PD40 domain-containing protein, partial [Isosphaeraceae bacterium]|nr:PD40 domain-containing protein [Isosphaeraceae bacterium]
MSGLAIVVALGLAAGPTEAGPTSEPRAEGERPVGTIAFASLAPRGWDLYRLDVANRREQRLTEHPALDYNAAFAPDGDRLAFVSLRDGEAEIYTIQADGSEPRRLTTQFALDDRPAWAPDGRRLVFSSTRQPADRAGRAWNALYVMDADGSNVRRLSPREAADYSPAWSPRGDLIACASGSGQAGQTDLVVLAPDGSGRRRVVADGGWPAFSADGQALFFHSKRDGRWGIWRVGLDGSEPERITPPDIEAYTPCASADGRWLAAAVRRGEHRQIVRIDLDDRSLTDLTDEPTDHWNPTIAPDGRSVVYHKVAPNA